MPATTRGAPTQPLCGRMAGRLEVALQVIFGSEANVAHIASKRSQLVMHAFHMTRHVFALAEHLGADGASERTAT